eukprot:9503960-Pyramimonas_sp.AAC.2
MKHNVSETTRTMKTNPSGSSLAEMRRRWRTSPSCVISSSCVDEQQTHTATFPKTRSLAVRIAWAFSVAQASTPSSSWRGDSAKLIVVVLCDESRCCGETLGLPSRSGRRGLSPSLSVTSLAQAPCSCFPALRGGMSEHYPSPRPARLLARRGPQQQAPPWDRNPENFLPCKAALLEALKRAEEEAAAARTDAASARRLAETARQELAESYRENAACNFELVRDLLQARREAQAEADDAAEARAALQDAEARQEATVARLREEHHAARAEDALEATEATGFRSPRKPRRSLEKRLRRKHFSSACLHFPRERRGFRVARGLCRNTCRRPRGSGPTTTSRSATRLL